MTTKDVHRACEALCRSWNTLGTIPPNIIEGYQQELAGATKKMQTKFFELIWAKCPDAAKLFFSASGELK